ncbi:MAG: alpha/beta hydrolase [Sphingobacteriales bacterium]|nr:MAG: alpha/beta hydrolase [Sphingobacteriales bacterium]
MSISLESAINAANQLVETPTGTVAYRKIGKGSPIILCNRFRGTLDNWDPKFLAELAQHFEVIPYDYQGIGLSTGAQKTTMEGMAEELKSFMDSLEIQNAAVLGWSYGACVAQAFAAFYPSMVDHLIIVGSNPAGKNDTAPEQIFFDTALKPSYTVADETILFFEPAWPKSVIAAQQSHDRIQLRKENLDVPVREEQFDNYKKGIQNFAEDKLDIRGKLNSTDIPILVLMGDHDPSFAVENWFPLVKESDTMQLLIIARSGHGPQHEHPIMTSGYISTFISNTSKTEA